MPIIYLDMKDKIRNRLEELTIEKWWDYGDYEEIRDKDYVAECIYNDFISAQKELFTKEDLYNCLGHFAYKYGITINGNDIDNWIKNLEK